MVPATISPCMAAFDPVLGEVESILELHRRHAPLDVRNIRLFALHHDDRKAFEYRRFAGCAGPCERVQDETARRRDEAAEIAH